MANELMIKRPTSSSSWGGCRPWRASHRASRGWVCRGQEPAVCADEGHAIDYLRVPVTDEKAPKEGDVELLLQRLAHAPPDAALVFNCQVSSSPSIPYLCAAFRLEWPVMSSEVGVRAACADRQRQS